MRLLLPTTQPGPPPKLFGGARPVEQQISFCPRCPGANTVRLRNTVSPVFRCGLILSPATPLPSPFVLSAESRLYIRLPSWMYNLAPQPPLPSPFVLSAGSRLYIRLPSWMYNLLPKSKDKPPSYDVRPKIPSCTATKMRPMRPLTAKEENCASYCHARRPPCPNRPRSSAKNRPFS